MDTDTEDATLRRLVLDELAWDALVDESGLDAVVEHGVVTLVGTVPSYAMKLAAREAARAVTGVHDMVDEIEVERRDERWSDAEIEEMLERVLDWTALVPADEVHAAVDDGWVTLTGSVAAASQRAAAEAAVAPIDGVRGVTNAIEVAPADDAPHEVRDAIATALRRRAAHRANHIDITVEGVNVTLRGVVQNDAERTAVLGAAAHARGVERVVCDELRVDSRS